MARRKQVYKKEWETDIDFNGNRVGDWCIKHPNKDSFGLCKVCNADIYVANTGKQSLKNHSLSKKHVGAIKNYTPQKSINSFVKQASSLEDKVLEAELRWSTFMAEHDLSSNLCEEVASLFRSMFPDSAIAGGFQCGRTKNTYLTTEGLSRSIHAELVNELQTTKFSVLIDESNKKHGTKYLHILVRYYHARERRVVTQFYKAVVVNTGTAESIVSALNASFEEDSIPWMNVLHIMSDSPNVMRGKKSGVIALVKNRYAPHLLDIGGCALHYIHNSVSYATESLGDEIEEFAVDVHSFFKHRTRLCDEFKEVQTLLELPEHIVLRFVGTRWLSILPVANRLLEQWDALKEFFNSLKVNHPSVASTERAKRIIQNLNSSLIRAKLMFLSTVLPQFERFEKMFQSEDVQIHILYDELSVLLKNIMAQFIKPAVMTNVQTGTDLLAVSFCNDFL